MKKAIESALEELYGLTGATVDISRTQEARFGVYTTNVAFLIAGQIGKSPVELARELVEHIHVPEGAFVAMAKNGHINFFLPEEIHIGHCQEHDQISDVSDYLKYRLEFLKKRLGSECRKLDRVQIWEPVLQDFYVQFFLYGEPAAAEKAFLEFDRQTDYRTLSNYQRNVFYTLVERAVDKLTKTA